ncbi:putative membrane protein [Mycobacteroides chelonae]|nr:putative membrane protein [Mycobacteroides chelonae]
MLAVGEIVNDKLPKTPRRKALPDFSARVVLGAFG